MRHRRWQKVKLALVALSSLAVINSLVLGQAPQVPQGPLQASQKLQGHSELVYAVSFSPDGRYVATGSFDKTLKLWDPKSGKEERTFGGPAGHQNLVLTLAFSPDGRVLASGATDNTIRLWDVPSPLPVRQFVGFEGAVSDLALSPDGSRLVAGGGDKSVRFFQFADGKQLAVRQGHSGEITAIAYSANGQLVATGGDETVRLWNAGDGNMIGTIGAHEGGVRSVAIHPNNSVVASTGNDGAVRLWQLPFTPSRTFASPHGDAVTAATVTPDGQRLITVSNDKTVRVWNAGNGGLERQLPLSSNGTCVFTQGSHIVAGAQDGSVGIWNLGDGALLARLSAHSGPVVAVAVNAQGNQLLTAGEDGMLRIWHYPPRPSRPLGHPDQVTAALVAGDRLITACGDKVVRFWNLQNGQVERQLAGQQAASALAMHPNGQFLAAGEIDGSIRFWHLGNNQSAGLVKVPGGRITAVAFHPNGSHLASAHEDGSAKLWTAANPPKETDKPVWEIRPGAVRALFFSADGNSIAIVSDKAVRFVHTGDGKETRQIPTGEAPVTAAGLSADRTRLATAGGDGKCIVWSLNDGKPLATIALNGSARSVGFSPDGTRLVVGYDDKSGGAVQVFHSGSGVLLQALPGHSGGVATVAFLPDGRTLVSAGADKLASVADVAIVHALAAHSGGVTAAVFLPNGSQIISAGKDKTVRLWDANKAVPARPPFDIGDTVLAAALTREANPSRLALAVADKTVRILSSSDGKEQLRLPHPAAVRSLQFSPDNTRLLTACEDGRARIWDLTTARTLEFFAHGGPVYTAVFHNDNRTLFVGGSDKAVVAHVQHALRVLPVVNGAARKLRFLPSGSHILVGGEDKAVKLVNLNSFQVERVFGASAPVTALAVSPNGQLVAAASADKLLRLYQFGDGKELRAIPAPDVVHSVSFAPNNTFVAAACQDRSVLIVHTGNFNPGQAPAPEFGSIQQIFDQGAAALAVAVHNDNATVLGAGADRSVRVFRIASPTPVRTLTGHGNYVDCVAFSPDGTQLASCGHDGTVRLWNVSNGQQTRQINAFTQPQVAPVYCVAWSPDGKQLAAGSFVRSIKIFNAADGNLVRELAGYDEKNAPQGHKDGVFTLVFHPSGPTLVSAGSDGQIKVWSIADGKVMRQFVDERIPPPPGQMQRDRAHEDWINQIRLSPDGKTLASVGNAGWIKLWDFASGKLLVSQRMPYSLYAVTFAPDGKTIAVGDHEGVASIIALPFVP